MQSLNIEQDAIAVGTLGAVARPSYFNGNLSLSGNPNNGTLALSGAGSVLMGSLLGTGTTTLTGNTNLKISSAVNRQGALSITGSGNLDLTTGKLIVDYDPANSRPDPINTVKGYIQQAYHNGAWNLPGLGSSSAATTAAQSSQTHKTALGFAEASALSTIPASFGTVNSTSVLVRYTYTGDANLDGVVDTSDFTAMASHFNGTSQSWTAGDFNYDGVVNALDFNAIATNYGQVMSSPALGSVVPEPTSAMAAIFATLLLRRRKIRLP
jgi:hypothetical protein